MRQPIPRLALLLTLIFSAACGSGSASNPGSGGRGGGATGGATTGTGGATSSGGASGSGGTGANGGARATGGATSSGGAGASGGRPATGGANGSGGATATSCPTVAPQPGGTCLPGLTCDYEDCAGAGRTIASCVSGASAMPRWTVTTGACATVSCVPPVLSTCPSGQVCVVRAGGAISSECVNNTCGASLLTCGCLQSCTGDCNVIGSVEAGFTLYCNTCPQGNCP